MQLLSPTLHIVRGPLQLLLSVSELKVEVFDLFALAYLTKAIRESCPKITLDKSEDEKGGCYD